MSQDIYSTINPATTSGTQLATLLVDFKEAMVSGMSGTARPTELDAGGMWIDITNAGSPNFYWAAKIYTGAVDIEVFRVNLTSSKVSISGADSNFDISKVSADTAGPLLKLIKSRIAGGGQVLVNDVVGEVQYVGTTDTGAFPIVAKIRALATDAMTSGAAGTYLSFEATADGTASLSEMMRLQDGFLGIGVTAPTARLHVRGVTGIRSEHISDDAVGALISLRKDRLAASGVQSSDVVGAINYRSTDDAAAEFTSSRVEASASENHTATARGTTLTFSTVQTTTTTLTSRMTIGNVIEAISRLDINSLKLISADVATTATIAALSASKGLIHMTGSTVTSIQGILSTSTSQVVVIHNRSTAAVTLKHEDAAATAADRIKLANATDLEILPDSSAELFYSISDSRWKIKSGSGSGGGALRVTSVQTLAGGGTISSSTTDYRQLRHVQGTGAVATTVSTTPFGTGGDWKDGTEIVLVGNDSDASVVIPFNDAANGCVGMFEEIELTEYKTVTFAWSVSLSRWILTAGGQ